MATLKHPARVNVDMTQAERDFLNRHADEKDSTVARIMRRLVRELIAREKAARASAQEAVE